MKPFLSVIIPAYNEAERIPLTLLDIDRILRPKDFSYEILVINDGSKDNTGEVVMKMAKAIKNLKSINNEENQGKGAVVRQGMLLARGEYRLFTDADNSTTIDQFDNMIPFFSAKGGDGYDVVIGSRDVEGSAMDPPQPFHKRLLGRVSNLIIQAVNLPGIWDTQCGFKGFTAEAAEKIFEKSRINGWGFDIEALALARAMGYKIKEMPVRWVNDLESRVKPSAYLKVFWENIRIKWWIMTDGYWLKQANREEQIAKGND